LLILLLQHLLGALLNKPQLQPETVRTRPPQGVGDDPAECRGLSPEAIGWLTVLFGASPNFCSVALQSASLGVVSFESAQSGRSRLGLRGTHGDGASPSSLLSFSRRTARISSRRRL
jgi:hypothetical protein